MEYSKSALITAVILHYIGMNDKIQGRLVDMVYNN
jgi:hypothetical protein